VSYLAELMNFC